MLIIVRSLFLGCSSPTCHLIIQLLASFIYSLVNCPFEPSNLLMYYDLCVFINIGPPDAFICDCLELFILQSRISSCLVLFLRQTLCPSVFSLLPLRLTLSLGVYLDPHLVAQCLSFLLISQCLVCTQNQGIIQV